MPWQADGKFLRVNPDFSGPTVWAQDQAVPIKIIATRHDYHDEDLADGIEDCLNINGLNALLANMDAGGFTIENLAGITSTEVVTVAGTTGAVVESNGVTFLKAMAGDFSTQITLSSGGGIQVKSSSDLKLEYGVTGAYWKYYAPLMPYKVTTTQKNAIASPTSGMTVYDTTLNKLCVYTTAWETVTSS